MPDPSRMVRAGDLIHSTKARELAGKPGPPISRPTLLRWRETRGFPEPVAELKVGRGRKAQTVDVYSRKDVVAWVKANPPMQ